MNYTKNDHTWLICAYKESPYLEECIQSIKAQTVKSKIQITTSTPCSHITNLAEKYSLELFINPGQPGIGRDWNFALSTGKTELLTIAHQDDVYEEDYTEDLLNRINQQKQPIMYFTNYGEIRDGNRIEKNKLLNIKRLLLLPIRMFPNLRLSRRTSLAFGNPICCPSITYRKTLLQENPFEDRFKSNLDWELTEKLSRIKGSFVYNQNIRMYHRIHHDSATTETIEENLRTQEDYEMMRKFWPDWVAKRLSKVYASSERSNQTK